MDGIWEKLHGCWTIPHARTDVRLALLHRQLRSFFRIVQPYSFTNTLTACLLLLIVWPGPDATQSLLWLACYVAVQAGWGVHAWTRVRSQELLSRRDLLWSAGWCFLSAVGWGVGLVAISGHIHEPGTLLLLSASTAGIMSTGALVGTVLPLMSVIWLGVLLLSSFFIVTGMGLGYQAATMGLLLLYASVLLGVVLLTSRLFVARVEAEMEADRERQMVGLLLGDFEESASDWLWETDAEGALIRAGPRLGQVLGLDEAAVVGARLPALFLDERVLSVASDKEVGAAALRERLKGEVAFHHIVVEAMVGGAPRSWRISAKPLHSTEGARMGWRGVGSEVSDARAREADSVLRERHLHHLATHDILTELPNRRAFLEQVRATEGRGTHAVALIDLDNFKAVNDSLGHSTGDAVLKMVAQRLARALHPGDMLVRLGGDEFALLLVDMDEAAPQVALEARLQRVLEYLRPPELVKNFRVDVRASIGATLSGKIHADPFELMRRADIALYAAKNSGRDTWKIYETSMGDKLKTRLSMVSDLSVAAERGQFKLAYQCIAELADCRIVGCEALLRWNHPVHGSISPLDCIPVAEESGLIVPIGLWVLEQACRDAVQWPPHLYVSVNVSAIQLESASIVESIMQVVERSGLDPTRLKLEITESSLMRDHPTARVVLRRLRELGIQLAIDDFGTGYSSMAQLRELPFDHLKLDQSFVAGISGDRAEASRLIIASLLYLSKSMRMTVTAEGVENMTQLELLRSLGCHYFQGNLYAKPLAHQDVVPLLQAGYLSQVH